MDPYLEDPELWPDVHNRLIAARANELSSRLRPIYYVALEERKYPEEPGELALVGQASEQSRTPTMVEVKLPIGAEVRETFIEVRTASEGEVVTVLELLSPANKRSGTGRRGAGRTSRRWGLETSCTLYKIGRATISASTTTGSQLRRSLPQTPSGQQLSSATEGRSLTASGLSRAVSVSTIAIFLAVATI